MQPRRIPLLFTERNGNAHKRSERARPLRLLPAPLAASIENNPSRPSRQAVLSLQSPRPAHGPPGRPPRALQELIRVASARRTLMPHRRTLTPQKMSAAEEQQRPSPPPPSNPTKQPDRKVVHPSAHAIAGAAAACVFRSIPVAIAVLSAATCASEVASETLGVTA